MGGEFAGKVAIVTGAASGISRVILQRFAQAGARTVLADLNVAWGQRVAEGLVAQGQEGRVVPTDVRDRGRVDAMVAQAVAHYGRVDSLVHGAGVGVHKRIVELSDEEWDLQVGVQLRGAFLLSRAVARRLIAQGEGGRLILIGSTSANN